MVYSSAFLSTYNAARALLGEAVMSARKVQTSDRREIDEAFLRAELGLSPAAAAPVSEKASGAVYYGNVVYVTDEIEMYVFVI
ncbi:hypothetical protein PUNSTDRAFT_136190 [Punctularia strigosozonata HHB-11173 SS5]|uniref:uncharacterized protein n=1 Tax=Punctularia strigosozonata (strain HHB-11173) TaxID=741275 RepID=UPI0004417C1C|nr:uncharacterized protein PUNSTDRAFT_136190 [Punctularia strigosozonata HHB-11173 SS5]EIN07511.1 hypothetical protein PUNSTDRAFT_136190 [Punctularia strigosozonata HHB-11173 SS5]